MIYWQEEGEEMGDGRADGSSASEDGGQVAISLTCDIDGTRSGSFLLSTLLKKWSSDVWAVALFSCHRWHGSTELHFESCCSTCVQFYILGPGLQKLTVPPQIRKFLFCLLHQTSLQFFSYFFLWYFLILSLGLQFHQVVISKHSEESSEVVLLQI